MGADRGTNQRGQKKSGVGVQTWNPKKVVATAPSASTIPPTGGAGWGGSADYWERQQEKLITEAGAPSAEESRNTEEMDLPEYTLGIPGFEGMTPSQIRSLFSGGSGSGVSASDKLARDKFNYEKKQSEAALAAMMDRYKSGGYRENADELLGLLSEQEKTGRADIGNVYQKALSNINTGYDEALRLAQLGYTGLEDFIGQNQIDPYAGYQTQLGTVTNPLEAVLGAYGVGSPDVQAQVAAEQFAGQQGAQSFQTLMDILSKAQQGSNLSRLAEAKMARTTGEAGLGAQRASYQSQAETAQASALSNLLNQIANSRFGVEQGVGQSADALANQIMQLGGNPFAGTTESTSQSSVPSLEDLAALLGAGGITFGPGSMTY